VVKGKAVCCLLFELLTVAQVVRGQGVVCGW